MLFRFSFRSDTIHDDRDGLMYDGIEIVDLLESIPYQSYNELGSKVIPNPGGQWMTIQFDNEQGNTFELELLDIAGRITKRTGDIRSSKIELYPSDLSPGLYLYRLISEESKRISFGKFIID